MWRVVYIASNCGKAEAIKGILTGEGFLVTVRPAGNMDGANGIFYEVLVPLSEVEEAHDAISQLLLSASRQGSGQGDDGRRPPDKGAV